MKGYYCSFLGVTVKISTPLEVQIMSETENFLLESSKDADEQFVIKNVEKLPNMPESGVWHQERLYTKVNGKEAVYFRSTPKSAPYAAVLYGPKKIECYCLQSEGTVWESSRILQLLGLEKILLRHKALILHASFIRLKGQGILFSAPSGTGKSTQADLWKKHMKAEIINGDRAGIRKKDGVWNAYGLPYAGSSRIYKNESALLKAIIVLEQGNENVIKELNQMEAMHHLLPEFSLQRWDEQFMQKALDQIIEILNEIPVYLFTCRPDKDAVKLLHDTIRNEEKR